MAHGDAVIEHPNREKAESESTKAAAGAGRRLTHRKTS